VPFLMLLVFALTLFASASLLFLVQPMVGKLLLPYLGGTPAVWATCMVFFQALLLAGYAYAHGLSRVKDVRKQLLIHFAVLLLPLATLYFLRFDVGTVADKVWSPPSDANPVPWLLTTLFLIAGLPFFAVSATAPLLQKWFSRTTHKDANDPYFLYGASNVGSMGALLIYPALVEPRLFLQSQTLWWSYGYMALALLILICGWFAIAQRARQPGDDGDGLYDRAAARTEPAPESDDDGRVPNWFDRLRWVLLAFVPSSVMIGCTTHLTTDIAAVPLLWILPLAVYLASFVLVFSRLPMWLSLGTVMLLIVALTGWLIGVDIQVNEAEIANAERPYHLFKGDWAYGYYWVQELFNARLSYFNLRHLLMIAAVAVLVGCCFRTPATIHTTMVVLAPIAGLAIAFEAELWGYFQLKEFERILLHVGVVFVVSMVCHGELARTRPKTAYLTEFYLLMSLGGVLGGMFNALLAPQVFDRIVEYPLLVAAMLLLMPWPGGTKERGWAAMDAWLVVGFGFVIGVFLSAFFLAKTFVQAEKARHWVVENLTPRWQPVGLFLADQLARDESGDVTRTGWEYRKEVLKRERNFFGTFTVIRETWTSPEGKSHVYHKMFHGTTTHGVQCYAVDEADGTRKTDCRAEALSYFHHDGPIGDLFADRARQGRPLRVAVLGVGTGTLAAYANRKNDTPGWKMTLFEIDPVVVKMAEDPEYFTFLADARKRQVEVDIRLGDGRQEFKKAEDGAYDLIFMDAFTSDAVPIHLITKEAIQIYLNKLAPGGVIIINVANRYLTFEALLGNLCDELGLSCIVGYGDVDRDREIYASSWVLMAKDKESLGLLPYKVDLGTDDQPVNRWNDLRRDPALGVWTDDYANLLSVFRWSR